MAMIALAIIGSLIIIAGLIQLSSDNVTQVEHNMAKDHFNRSIRLGTFMAQKSEERRNRYNAMQQMANEPSQKTYENETDNGNVSISVTSTDLDADGNFVGELHEMGVVHREALDQIKRKARKQTRSMYMEERGMVAKQFHERAMEREEHAKVEGLVNTEIEKEKTLRSHKLIVNLKKQDTKKQLARCERQKEVESKKEAPKVEDKDGKKK